MLQKHWSSISENYHKCTFLPTWNEVKKNFKTANILSSAVTPSGMLLKSTHKKQTMREKNFGVYRLALQKFDGGGQGGGQNLVQPNALFSTKN